MTEETVIERLDFGKPPPDPEVGAWGGAWGTYLRSGGETVWESAWLNERVEALAAAWTHYKAHNDPPGMLVSHKLKAPALEWWAAWVFMPDGSGRCQRVASGTEADARAAAWAWHDRRHALAQKPDGVPLDGRRGLCLWPRCLTWTDEQVAEVERWLRDSTAEVPEVLRPSEATTAPPCRRCTECTGQEHHWLSEPDLQDEEADFEEGVNDYVYRCKHCPATRPYDPDEDEGDDRDEFDIDADDFESPEEIEERRAAGECVCDGGLLSIPCPRCDGGDP